MTPISEKKSELEKTLIDPEELKITATQWLCMKQYWPVAFAYLFTRMSINTNMSLMPFYLTIVVHAGGISDPDALAYNTPWQLAMIPLISYAGSIGTSLLLERLGKDFTRKT